MSIAALFVIGISTSIILLYLRKRQKSIEILSVIASILEGIVGSFLMYRVLQTESFSYGYFRVDALSALMIGITLFLNVIATVYAVGYLRGEREKQTITVNRLWQCYLCLQIFFLSMIMALLTSVPIIMWIAIEGTTLSTAFLINFFERERDIEAPWKYLIINTLGLLLALLGTLIFSATLKGHRLITWETFIENAHFLNPVMVKYGFVLILIGYGTKMGLVPLHTWKPDAYNKGPIPLVALLSTAILNVALYALLRFRIITDMVLGPLFAQQLFIFFGIISLAVGSVIVYTQRNYKRLLAYSSIESAGLFMLAFAFGGVGTIAGLLHIIYNSLSKALLFFVAGNSALKYSSSEIKDVRGMATVLPTTSILLVIGFLSITGLPPFGMFLTELYILLAGIPTHPFIVGAMFVCLLLVFIGFLRMTFSMVYGSAPTNIPKGETNNWTIVPLIILGAFVLISGVYLPPFIITLVQQSFILLQQ